MSSASPVAVNPPDLAPPSGYSHGTLVGNTLHLGGQTALDREMRIVPGGIVEQFRQAFGNVLTTLRHVGGEPGDLVSVTIYLTDVPEYQAQGSRDRQGVARAGGDQPIPRWRASGAPRCGSPRR